ncbi:NlpC/P60 family protein [Streptomyces sp. SID5468]|nr:NlpC/P60 family protein [Streptomyces sp. SID5468]
MGVVRVRGAVVASTTVLACVAGLAAGPGQGQALAARPRTIADVRAATDRLYRQAEVATEAYDAATEQVERQQRDLVALARAVVAAQADADRLTRRLGALAAARYRAGAGLPAGAGLLLATDPESFLDAAGVAEQGARATEAAVLQLRRKQRDLAAYAHAATTGWERLTAQRRRRADARREVESRLRQAEALLATLRARDRQRLREAEDEAAYQAQTAWLRGAAGARPDLDAGGAGALAARAVAFATAQLGKAYQWGAQGPDSYDCSGLTEMAWAAAGVTIPRTSQEQWAGLPHVPLDRLRPGDLVIYYPDAGHVALYVGGGAVIQAPRPGRPVSLAGAGSMPILGAVRPG